MQKMIRCITVPDIAQPTLGVAYDTKTFELKSSDTMPVDDLSRSEFSASGGCRNCNAGGYTCSSPKNPQQDCEAYCTTFDSCVGFFFYGASSDSNYGRCCPVKKTTNFAGGAARTGATYYEGERVLKQAEAAED